MSVPGISLLAERPASAYVVISDVNELMEMFQRANGYSSAGRDGAALETWKRDAARGASWSLTSSLWAMLIGQEFNKGEEFFRDWYPVCQLLTREAMELARFPGPFECQQTTSGLRFGPRMSGGDIGPIDSSEYGHVAANFASNLITALSNYSLIRIASGRDPQLSCDVWLNLFDIGFVRGALYASVAKEYFGDRINLRADSSKIPVESYQGINEYLMSNLGLQGWIGDWFQACLRHMRALEISQETANVRGTTTLPPRVYPSVKVGICNCESEVVPLSVDVPVVLLFRGLSGSRSQSTVDEFQELASSYGGRFVLGLIDLHTEPSLTKAFGVQELPSVFGVIREQFYELAIGPLNAHQTRAVVEQFLEEALRQGVRGNADANWKFRQLQQGQSGFVPEPSVATGQQVQESTTTRYVGYGVAEWEIQEPPAEQDFDFGDFF